MFCKGLNLMGDCRFCQSHWNSTAGYRHAVYIPFTEIRNGRPGKPGRHDYGYRLSPKTPSKWSGK